MATLLAHSRRLSMMRTLFGLERPQKNLPMLSSVPGKRSKVVILLRKMSEQSGWLNRHQTPKILPAGASLSLISAERDGHFAGALPPLLDDAHALWA